MAKHKLLQDLIAQRDEIDAAIRVVQRMYGGGIHAHATRQASAALRHSRNGATPPKRKYTRRDSGAEAAPADTMPVPTELREAIKNLDFREAVALAVRSAGVAIPSRELMALLDTAGVVWPKASRSVPRARYLGIVAGNLARQKRLKKTPHGWTIGSKRT